jgi:hypothetical protein
MLCSSQPSQIFQAEVKKQNWKKVGNCAQSSMWKLCNASAIARQEEGELCRMLCDYLILAVEGKLSLRAVKGELSPTSDTVTSLQKQSRFEASLKGLRKEAHSAAFKP